MLERRVILIPAFWLIVAISAYGFIAVGIHDRYRQLITVESSANILVGQLQPDQARALQDAGISPIFYAIYLTALDSLVTLSFATTGLVLAWLRPKDRTALLVSVVLIGGAMTAISVGMTHPRWHLVVTSIHAVWAASLMPTLFLFPNGHFVPRWTRWLAAIWLIYTAVWLIFPEFSPPFGFNQGMTDSEIFRISWFMLWFCAGLAAQVYRYYRISNAMERQQTRWIILGFWPFLILFVFGIAVLTLSQLAPLGGWTMVARLAGISIFLLSTLAIPLSLGFSILRFQLFDIHIIINRTLVYITLTASVFLIYILVVGGLGIFFQTQDNLIIALLATGTVAVLFHPLREWLQSRVNRLIYGERDDPVEALSRLGKQMELALPSDQVLPMLVKTIAQTLKIPFVGVKIKGQQVISFGQDSLNSLAFPFIFEGDTNGVLLASPRIPGESFSSEEMRILQNLARQAGVVVRNAQLAADLQRSRQNLVTAREEERHRLRRDLHDGIGPTMAGLTLKLDAVKDLISSSLQSRKKDELEEAIQLLNELKAQAQEMVQNIRHIVHTLRPPSLAVLGLIPALQAHLGRVATPRGLNFQMSTSPQHFPDLSAAVEVASYRIVLEAVTNVINHAQAGNCEVSLTLENGNLMMQIKDDGIGLAHSHKNGIGLDSMRERAEELGGHLELSSSPHGTIVYAEIPISPPRNEH